MPMEQRGDPGADGAVGLLRPDPVEMWLAERGLAVARLVLAMALLAAVRVELASTLRHPGPSVLILAGYALFAAVVWLVLLLRKSTIPRRFPAVVQVVDVCVAVALTLISTVPGAPFFPVLVYPVFSAAYRWGLREVIVTVVATEAALFAGVMASARVTTDAMLVPAVLVGATGAIAGYLGEHTRRARFEDRTISMALARARLGGKLGETVYLVLTSARQAFRAAEVLVVLHEKPSGRVLVWTARPADDEQGTARPDPVPVSQRDDYLFDVPGAAWHASARWWRRDRRRFSVVAVDERGRRLPSTAVIVPDGLLAEHRSRRLIGVPLQFGQDWAGRLLIVGPGMGVSREQSARFALRLANHIAPALYDHYLARQLRTHARSLERRRIASELHDGVTQSLLGLEMEVVVLQRRAIEEAPQLVADLSRVHRIVRDEVVTVRELMEGIRVGEVQAGNMLQHLSELVDRFSRHTGIAARFLSDGVVAELSAYNRRELARIVHEALVNIRKHSGADRVLLKAGVVDHTWLLSIEDDGRGFAFAGRRTLEALEAHGQGPRTIVERIRIIGGDLTIESRPGFGTRLEISVPLAPSTQHPALST